MRHPAIAALAIVVVALTPVTPVTGAQAGSAANTHMAMLIETAPVAAASGLQPPESAGADVVPPASAAGAATDRTPAAAARPEAIDEEPSETATTRPPDPVAPPVRRLVVVGWGGAYGQALRRGVLDPFRDNTQVEIEALPASSAGGLPPSTVSWDVADVSPAVAKLACERGLIVRLDTLRLSPGAFGTTPDQDFMSGSLGRCAVGSFAWSSLVLIDPKAFRKGAPETLADVFDGRRFKQKRAFARSPRYLLEMALIADGVAPGRVYGELSTRSGLSRAFKKLDGIRKWIVWSDKPESALKLLGKGEAAMATAFSGRAFYAMASELKPYRMIWDGQIYDLSVWVVSSASAARPTAEEFVAYATRADRLAAVSRWFPYGPVRLSALELVGRHPTLGLDLQSYLPTTPANLATAVRFNELFWRQNETALMLSLEAWIAGKDPLPPEPPAAGAAARSG